MLLWKRKKNKRKLVDVSQQFTLPGEVKRKEAHTKRVNSEVEEIVEQQQEPFSPLTSEEVTAFENLITYLRDSDIEVNTVKT